jgi:fructose-bisphosphate aldolase, class I
MNDQQFQKIKSGRGFIAALDQSGGSTPKALEAYGIPPDAYSDDDEMFALMHEMRTRLITSPSFSGDRIIGAILFEDTLDRDVEGRGSADYLWNVKTVVPFIKVDKGLADVANGVQVMKPMPELDTLLDTAIEKGVFGTKMRSFIKMADEGGIKAIVTQQFEIAHQILGKGLVPIVEPEIDIHSPEKGEAERLLKADIFSELGQLSPDQYVMVKISLPEEPNFYTDLMRHPNVLRVVALSGGYTRQEADAKLTTNHDLIASFSRALTEGLTVSMTDKEFDDALDKSIASIYAASLT